VDIASYLVKGDNLIEVDAEMHGGAAGFVCQMGVMIEDKLVVMATDKTWEFHGDGRWQGVGVIKAHGEAPWQAVLGATLGTANGSSDLVPPVRAALVKNDFLMRSLGRPHRDQVVTTRPNELTTLQAIDLSNGDVLAGYLSVGGKTLSKKRTGADLVEWLYRYALSRAPTTGERTVLVEVVGDARDPIAVEDLLWPVFMLPEFQIIR
jgi:hypothetical protein